MKFYSLEEQKKSVLGTEIITFVKVQMLKVSNRKVCVGKREKFHVSNKKGWQELR